MHTTRQARAAQRIRLMWPALLLCALSGLLCALSTHATPGSGDGFNDQPAPLELAVALEESADDDVFAPACTLASRGASVALPSRRYDLPAAYFTSDLYSASSPRAPPSLLLLR